MILPTQDHMQNIEDHQDTIRAWKGVHKFSSEHVTKDYVFL